MNQRMDIKLAVLSYTLVPAYALITGVRSFRDLYTAQLFSASMQQGGGGGSDDGGNTDDDGGDGSNVGWFVSPHEISLLRTCYSSHPCFLECPSGMPYSAPPSVHPLVRFLPDAALRLSTINPIQKSMNPPTHESTNPLSPYKYK